MVAGVLAADHRRSGPVILSHEPGLKYGEGFFKAKHAHTTDSEALWVADDCL